MSITQQLELIREDIEYEIGQFEIMGENDNELLIKANDGCYFIAKKNTLTKRFLIEDITWVVDKILSKKKKQKYINDSRRKGEFLNGK